MGPIYNQLPLSRKAGFITAYNNPQMEGYKRILSKMNSCPISKQQEQQFITKDISYVMKSLWDDNPSEMCYKIIKEEKLPDISKIIAIYLVCADPQGLRICQDKFNLDDLLEVRKMPNICREINITNKIIEKDNSKAVQTDPELSESKAVKTNPKLSESKAVQTDQLQDHINVLTQQLYKVNKQLEEETARSEDFTNMLKRKLEEMSSSYKAREKELNFKQTQLEQKNTEIKNLQLENTEHKNKTKEQQEEIRVLELENTEHKNKTKEQQKKIRVLELENIKNQKTIQEMEIKRKELESIIDTFVSKTEPSYMDKTKEQQEEIRVLELENTEHKNKTKEQQKKIRVLELENIKNQKTIQEMEIKRKELESIIDTFVSKTELSYMETIEKLKSQSLCPGNCVN